MAMAGTSTDLDWLPILQIWAASLKNGRTADARAEILKAEILKTSRMGMMRSAADSLAAVLERLGQIFVQLMAQYCMTIHCHLILSHRLKKRLAQLFKNSNQTISGPDSNNEAKTPSSHWNVYLIWSCEQSVRLLN